MFKFYVPFYFHELQIIICISDYYNQSYCLVSYEQARKELVKVFLANVVEERRKLKTNELKTKKFMVHLLMETEDEEGRRLNDEEIVDLVIIYLLAGHESFAHASTWAVIHLNEHPEYHQKAKVSGICNIMNGVF